MKKLLFILGLLLAVFLAYKAVPKSANEIENDIKTRLAQSFVEQGVSDDIRVEVSGRDVILSGTVSKESSKAQADQLASKLYGVRVVDNNIQLLEQEQSSVAVTIPEPEVRVFSPEVDFVSEAEVVMPELGEVNEPIFDLGALESAVEAELSVEPPQQEALSSTPVVEEAVAETVANVEAVVPEEIKLDGPLPVKYRRIVRRGVDTVTAGKTVEAACEDNLTTLLEGEKINFDSGRATIQARSHALLDRIIVAAKNCHDDTIITINGYTDNTGDLEANRLLSLQRARAVGRYMLKRGVAKQVKVVGHGANDPIADNDTEEGRAQNRRIEFKVFTSEDQE